MSALNHTPLPWSINDWTQRDAEIRIGATGTPVIATVNLRDVSINEQKANAELIVTAVNAHVALCNAAVLALALIKDNWPLEHGSEQVGRAWGALENALAKAGVA
jgi:hypothetical protein